MVSISMQMAVTLSNMHYSIINKLLSMLSICAVVSPCIVLCTVHVYGLRIHISYSVAIFLYDQCIAQN